MHMHAMLALPAARYCYCYNSLTNKCRKSVSDSYTSVRVRQPLNACLSLGLLQCIC